LHPDDQWNLDDESLVSLIVTAKILMNDAGLAAGTEFNKAMHYLNGENRFAKPGRFVTAGDCGRCRL